MKRLFANFGLAASATLMGTVLSISYLEFKFSAWRVAGRISPLITELYENIFWFGPILLIPQFLAVIRPELINKRYFLNVLGFAIMLQLLFYCVFLVSLYLVNQTFIFSGVEAKP